MQREAEDEEGDGKKGKEEFEVPAMNPEVQEKIGGLIRLVVPLGAMLSAQLRRSEKLVNLPIPPPEARIEISVFKYFYV